MKIATTSHLPTLLSPAPRASLALRGLHTVLHEQAQVENVVRVALREGTRNGHVANAGERAAVASAIFGTSLLRAKLSRLLAMAPPHTSVGAIDPAARRWLATAQLLALFLLHETPQRVSCQDMAAALPPGEIGLPAECLDELAALDWADVRWPTPLVPRLAARYSLPCSLVRRWSRMLRGSDAEVEALCAALARPGPVTLRVNLVAHRTRASLADSLRADGIACRAGTLSPWALHLDGDQGRSAYGGSVWNLEAWQRGDFEVQDEGSQLVALACDARSGERVLDLCAGNGGKTLAMAACVGASGHVLAHDIVPSRLAALRASAGRARVDGWVCTTAPVGLAAAAAAHAPAGHDVVLVDAPCSSSGTLRRHPGLRWSRAWAGESAAAMERRALPALQLQLLHQGVSLARDGGRLVYATCALDTAENEAVALAFEAARGEQLEPWPFDDEEEGGGGKEGSTEVASHYRTLWPHRHEGAATDGFFIARWRVRAAAPQPASAIDQ